MHGYCELMDRSWSPALTSDFMWAGAALIPKMKRNEAEGEGQGCARVSVRSRPRVKPHCLERMEQNASGFRIGTCPGSGRHLASRGTPKSTASPCTAQPRGDAEWQGELRSLAKTIPPRLRQQISSGTLHSSYPLPILISSASSPPCSSCLLQEIGRAHV